MKYTPPQTGAYESNLTARLLYDSVDRLIRDEIINKGTVKEDIARSREKSGGVFPLGKLWDKPEIRRPLEEFVQSYFFTGLQEPLLGFAEIFQEGNREKRNEKLMSYVGRLRQEYGIEYNAIGEAVRLLRELKKRGDAFFAEVKKIKDLDGLKLVKYNAIDTFGQIFSPFYNRIVPAMSELG